MNELLAGFDSGTTMLSSLKHSLRGEPFGGVVPTRYVPAKLLQSINALPDDLRKWIYRTAGAGDAPRSKALANVSMEHIAERIVEGFPDRTFPAIAVGSANGALIHLCAALGIPWLPQTLLVTAKRDMHPDDLMGDAVWGEEAVHEFLSNNPDVAVHQMHDPVQDRLMVAKVGYFRMKYLRLPRPYRRFIRERLEPGGCILLSDCSFTWPVSQRSDRHFFQVGGYGTTTPEEYLYGSERVREFLKSQEADVEEWDAPDIDGEQPEAEWGFVHSLAEDLARMDVPMHRIRFKSPESLSPFVADCYKHWYSLRGCETESLLVDCFANIDPQTTFQARAVPYWLVFNTSVSAERLEHFCRSRSFKRARLILMANGLEGIGAVSIARWREIVSKAAGQVAFVGVDEKAYPNDPASFVSYAKDLKDKLAPLRDPPRLLQVDELQEFFSGISDQYLFDWERNVSA
ncbi:MAG: hypothetical protein GF344_07785 [Chitinivibrionales bacterium]|nr:hypothetical protein [Chitinivibrionales bacterium]MBD3356793.1 hypothetical protein [Chitinivibrionales bacterium]